jgi:hypothetical protein
VYLASLSEVHPETDISGIWIWPTEGSRSLGKFRAILGTLAFREALDGGGFSVFSDYLSWEELIHTCYFDVSRFRKLVAYAISTADGFRATEMFKHDPDYPLVEKWFQEIQNCELQESKGEEADIPPEMFEPTRRNAPAETTRRNAPAETVAAPEGNRAA